MLQIGSIAIDDDDKARTGMYASAEIVLAEANGLSLPLSAITTSKDGVTVRLVKDGIVHQVKVETGIQDGSFIQVTKGLDDGAEVVAKAGAGGHRWRNSWKAGGQGRRRHGNGNERNRIGHPIRLLAMGVADISLRNLCITSASHGLRWLCGQGKGIGFLDFGRGRRCKKEGRP